MASSSGPDLNGLPALTSSTSPLDLQKLSSLPAEQQDLYVLSYLSDLEKLVLSFDSDGATGHQFFVKKELIKIINLPQPAPTKITREIAGKCFAEVFGKGDRKLLYESINEMVAILGSGKGDKELKAKHAAAHCLGEIYRAAGDSAVSLSTLVCTSLLKLLKVAQNHAGIRGTVFKSLGKIARMLGNSLDESVSRDVWKQARNTASQDKSWLAQASALQCLEELVKGTKYFESPYDLEKLKSTIFKTWEVTGAPGRRAAASCYAAALVNAYATDEAVAALKSNKRMSKKIKRQSTMPIEDEDERPGTPNAPPASSRKANAKVNLTLEEILTLLSTTYVKTTTSPKVRAGIINCYAQIFVLLGSVVVETSYGVILNHLLNDLLSNPNISHNRYRLLLTRRWVRILVEDVIGMQLLGESGQLNAVKFVTNNILKNYPAVLKERPEPSKYALAAALSALVSLIQSLGANIASVQDLIRDGLLQILQHPSYSVQVAASWCLKLFVLASPSQLLPVITICMNNVNRELGLLANRRPTMESFRKCVGFANGLAALISCGSMEPLYASIDVTSRVLNLATSLLKSSGDYDLRISSTQIQVAWILIGGLMSLGPNFVKVHLSQLLLLWKNALPKPLAKDTGLDRTLFELSFLAHVRECALGSILAFLEFNQRLVTTDVAKRLAAMLQNSTLFLNSLPTAKRQSEDSSQKLSPSLNLVDLDLMVRRRILQCYLKLVKLSQGEALQPNLLTIAASFFADPEKYTPSSLSTLIQSAGGSFEGLWDVTDGYAYGVCSLVRRFDIESFAWEEKGMGKGRGPGLVHWTSQHSPAGRIDNMLNEPVIGAIEHDSVTLYTRPYSRMPEPAPPATEVVNAAIDLFCVLLPAQPPKVQESMLEQITNFIAASSLQKDPGRKAALTVNVSVAILGTLKYAQTESRQAQVVWKQSNVLKIVQSLLQQFVIYPDAYVRNVALEALGRLCSIGGNVFTGAQIKFLIDKIVADIDPNVRAGCAAALGCIHSNVGGMAASLHMKTILGILLSLSNDPHPIVHFWALEGLARTIDSAGLNFSGYVNSTLGMMAQLFIADTHDEEVAAIITGNMESDLNTTAVIVKCCNALVGVLGPDLMHMNKLRDMILNLLAQFFSSPNPIVLQEALKCMEHVSLFASGSIDMKLYLGCLYRYLNSSEPDLQGAAIDGLYQVMKGDAEKIIAIADGGLEDMIWEALDDHPANEGIRNIIKNWLAQATVENAGVWVKRCQTVMTKLRDRRGRYNNVDSARKGAGGGSGGLDLQDEEVASFAAQQEEGGGSAPAPGSGQEHMRWQVRAFAMECLEELLTIISKKGDAGIRAIMEQVAEIIRMAFTASTAHVVALRLKGLKVIDRVLKMFGKTPDPDFPEAMLLEQYQAQISSALTPAFAADSSPELAAEAVSVCAGFISTGVVKDVDRMGRILRLLTSTLENFSTDTENASIGDLKGLSSNAQVMVKMSVLGAWAELQVASLDQPYLVDVVKPHITTLAPMWLASLREFARLRFEPDISTSTASTPASAGSIDMMYSSLNRDVLLKFYQDSWLGLVDAIASLIEQDSQFVFDALDGKTTANENGQVIKHDISYRDEPVAFFFVLFGIAFEALVGRPGGSDSLATKEQILEVLLALKKILHPSVCGQAVYQEAIFSETVDLLDRLVLTEGRATQLAVIDIARGLCVAHPSARSGSDDNLSEDINQLFELTRLIVLVLTGQLPNLTDNEKPSSQTPHGSPFLFLSPSLHISLLNTNFANTVRTALVEDAVDLIRTALDALVDAAEVFPSVIKMDLYASILHIFASKPNAPYYVLHIGANWLTKICVSVQAIFGTGVCQAEVVPKSLPIFKRFIGIATRARGATHDISLVTQLRGCLSRLLAVMENARRLNTETSLHCVRNCMMASTIILTAGVNVIPPQDAQLSLLCDLLLAGTEDPITIRTAVQCCRTLLLTSSTAPSDVAVAAWLLPKIVSYVAADDSKETEDSKGLMSQLLVAYLRTLRGDKVKTAMSIFIPALLARCSHASDHEDSHVTKKVYRNTAAILTDMVSQDAATFKGIMLGLSPEQRTFLEEVLRTGSGPDDNGANKSGQSAPAIALKMSF